MNSKNLISGILCCLALLTEPSFGARPGRSCALNLAALAQYRIFHVNGRYVAAKKSSRKIAVVAESTDGVTALTSVLAELGIDLKIEERPNTSGSFVPTASDWGDAPETPAKVKKFSGRTFARISAAELEAKISQARGGDDSEGRGDTSSLTPQVSKDLSKVSFDTENIDSTEAFGRGAESLIGFQTLPNGLTYLGVTAGGDWEQPIFFIIYWDGKKLRGYIPTDGNPWNTGTKQAYGNDEEADARNVAKRYNHLLRTPGGAARMTPEDLMSTGIPFEADNIRADIQARIQPAD